MTSSTEMQAFEKNFQRFKQDILKQDNDFMQWLFKHLAEKNGHYYQDPGWMDMRFYLAKLAKTISK